MALLFPQGPGGDAWVRITIAGVAFGGKATVAGAAREVRVDERNRRGTRGATYSLHGPKAAQPKITLEAWTEEHMAQLTVIAERCMPSTRSARHDAVAVEHPALAFHGITQVLVVAIEGPELEDDGRVKLTLATREYHQPAAAPTRRPSAARETSTTEGPGDGTALDDVYSRNPIPAPPSQGPVASFPPTRPVSS